MLAYCADGTKLKLLIVFKRKTLPNGSFPQNKDGLMKRSCLIGFKWYRKRDRAFFDSKGLLILDFMKVHIKESLTAVANKKNIGVELCIIPGGLTKILQPLET